MCEVGTLSTQHLRDLGEAVRAEQDRRTRQAVAAAIRAAGPGLPLPCRVLFGAALFDNGWFYTTGHISIDGPPGPVILDDDTAALVESLLADLSGPAHTVPVLPIHLHT